MNRFQGCCIDELDCMAQSIKKETRLQLATLLLRLFDELDSEIAARTSREEAESAFVAACERVETARHNLDTNGFTLIIGVDKHYKFTTPEFRAAYAESWHAARLYKLVLEKDGLDHGFVVPPAGLIFYPEQHVLDRLQEAQEVLGPGAIQDVSFDVPFRLIRN